MSLVYYLSYRDDARGVAGRFFDRLEERYGEGNVMVDAGSRALGHDYGVTIERVVGGADVFIALISPRWLDAVDDEGQRRIDDPDDVVLLEVETALRAEVPIIPVLVDGARMPHRGELPESIAELARRSPVTLNHATFRADAAAFMDDLDEIQFRPDLPPAAVQAKPYSPPAPPVPVVAHDEVGLAFLDMVRNKRFRMARKSGYEVLEVDEFVDLVEQSLAAAWEPRLGEKSDPDVLTTADVRNQRFRMARKSGYEVLEVDRFIDEVEQEFARLDRR